MRTVVEAEVKKRTLETSFVCPGVFHTILQPMLMIIGDKREWRPQVCHLRVKRVESTALCVQQESGYPASSGPKSRKASNQNSTTGTCRCSKLHSCWDITSCHFCPQRFLKHTD